MQAVEREVGSPKPEEPDWYPVFNLIYLAFLFLPLFWLPDVWAGGFLPWTLVSVVVFLPLYRVLQSASTRTVVLGAAAIEGLGLALAPINPFANTYVIYSCAALGTLPRRRQAIGGSVLALVLYALWNRWLGWPDSIALLTAVIAAGVVVGNQVWLANQRQNYALKLSQDEAKQLARVAERERIGRDLHDLLGHSLSVIALKAELAGKLLDRDPGQARRELAELETVARQALTQVRSAVVGIRSAGLRAELTRARLALGSAGLTLEDRIELDGLDPQTETTFALVLREAITNVLRHAEAERCRVVVEADGKAWRLAIEDDGRGLRAPPRGTGSTSIRERVAALGGTVEWSAVAGGGTRLQVLVPRRPARAAGLVQPAADDAPN